MELMQAVEHYATAMKLAERYGNDHGDVDAANNAWRECKKAADELQEYARDVLRLVETVKYLRGIAKRGEGREMRDDETVEGFVLGYVQRLERTLRRCTAVGCRYAPDAADEPTDNGMCPNCVTPWKCNGPHELTPNAKLTGLSDSEGPR